MTKQVFSLMNERTIRGLLGRLRYVIQMNVDTLRAAGGQKAVEDHVTCCFRRQQQII